MTPQQRLDYLLADETTVDTNLYTARKVGSILGAVDYEIAMTTLEGMASQSKLVRDALKWLNSETGLDFSDVQTQSLIDQAAAAGNWAELSPGLAAKLKGIGIISRPRWQVEGMASAPTLASVQAIIDAENLATLRENLQTRFNAIKNQIGTVEQADAVVALRAIADELEE